MSKLVLYYKKSSPPCRAVLLLIKILKLNVEIKNMQLSNGDHQTEEFLKLNPSGTIPVLDDNGDIIFESHAIMIYLVEKYSPNNSLYPNDILIKARINSILHVETGLLFGRFLSAVEQPMKFKQITMPAFMIDNLHNSFERIEKILFETGDFLSGRSVTLGDISCLPTVTAIEGFIDITKEKYPLLLRWKQRMFDLYPGLKQSENDGATLMTEILNSVYASLKLEG